MDIRKEFGEKIKRMRKNKGLTQEALAELINITPRNMSGIEIGENFVKAETLERILSALDTTTEELFANDHLREINELIEKINNDIKSIAQNPKNKSKLQAIYKIVSCIKNI